uniref:Fatty acid amide hydrolase (Trinotate prediction) n=1 Tax=Henneguya salminicola TaxID=69463 RepID=A0A6G3MEI7_HENSL
MWPLEIDCEPTNAPIVQSSDEINFQPIDLDKILISKRNWPYATIFDYRTAYLEKRTTPTEVAKKLLELCLSDKIRNLFALVEIKGEELIQAAQESTERYEQNKSLSVIDGVPFFVKEHIKITNYTTYYGLGDNEQQSMTTAFCIQKLLEKGGMLVGTTTMPQFGTNAIGSNPDVKFPSPIYPWDSTKYPGGSSSGNGVLVGMGLCPFSIGSDGLGSIRVPSGFNGIVGLRSTFSRISNEGCTNDPNQNPCLVIGPMSSSVGDAAIVYSIISGPDSNFTLGLNQPLLILPNFINFDIKSIKFGFCPEYIESADKSLKDNFNQVIEKLKMLGCQLIPIKIPEMNVIIY